MIPDLKGRKVLKKDKEYERLAEEISRANNDKKIMLNQNWQNEGHDADWLIISSKKYMNP